MPTEQLHQEQAEANEKAANQIKQTIPDWAVTICFYAALHYVERYAKRKGDDIENDYQGQSLHVSRRKYVNDIAFKLRNRSLRIAYENLERASRKARYLEKLPTNARSYYTERTPEVTKSFQNLRTVKQLLDFPTKGLQQ